MQTLAEAISYWKNNGDEPHTHQRIYDEFLAAMEADRELRAHRDHIEKNNIGLGCRMFSWLWQLIIDSMPKSFSALEIGVYYGQSITTWELIAARQGKDSLIAGVSTFDGRDLNEDGSDYFKLVLELFDKWNLRHPILIRGNSTWPATVDQARTLAPLDLLYVDGGHSKETATSDIINYAPMLRVGGLLTIDDSANRFKLPPCTPGINFFHGIQTVSDAVDELLPPYGSGALPDGSRFEQVLVAMHIRCFKRIL